jgi:uncharacterized protein with PQ loop repeat
MSLEFIGWLGGICFAICGAPQAWQSFKSGNSRDITWGFLILWTVGEILTLIYTIPKGLGPLIFNYTLNLIFLSIIIYYKIRPRI